MRALRRRLPATAGVTALVVLAGPVAAALAQDGASDSGGQDAGESASAWDPGGALFWTAIVVALLAVLIVVLVLSARGGGDDERPAARARGRAQVRGTFAGHYLDEHDLRDEPSEAALAATAPRTAP